MTTTATQTETRQEWMDRMTTFFTEQIAFNRGQDTPYTAEGYINDYRGLLAHDGVSVEPPFRRRVGGERVLVQPYAPSDDDIAAAHAAGQRRADMILDAFAEGRERREARDAR